jgi:hypothetical protein
MGWLPSRALRPRLIVSHRSTSLRTLVVPAMAGHLLDGRWSES